MNNCYFIGTFTEKPKLDKSNGISYIYFELEITEYRKIKTGEKIKNFVFLPFEAYHTGAETIQRLAQKGAKIAAQCSAKTWTDENGYESVVFRINEFDFSCGTEEKNEKENTIL